MPIRPQISEETAERVEEWAAEETPRNVAGLSFEEQLKVLMRRWRKFHEIGQGRVDEHN